jgi:hypothetical protein
MDSVISDIGESIGPPQNPEQIGPAFGRQFPTPGLVALSVARSISRCERSF